MEIQPKRKNRLKLEIVLADLKSGLSAKQIAERYGVPYSSVRNFCSKHGISLKGLSHYKNLRADIFALKQSLILNEITRQTVGEASLRDKMMAFNILYNAERLARGLSTENVNLAALTNSVVKIDEEIKTLEQKIYEKYSQEIKYLNEEEKKILNFNDPPKEEIPAEDQNFIIQTIEKFNAEEEQEKRIVKDED